MIMKTYLKFYQEYFKMFHSIYHISRHMLWREKLPIGPFFQMRSHYYYGLSHNWYYNLKLYINTLVPI